MHVALLYFDGCPNWRTAETRVREALARLGRDHVAVTHRPVETQAQAETAGFRGSPTILVDGRDPFADPQAPWGCPAACTPRRRGSREPRRSPSSSRCWHDPAAAARGARAAG